MYGGTVTATRNLVLKSGSGSSTIGLYDGKERRAEMSLTHLDEDFSFLAVTEQARLEAIGALLFDARRDGRNTEHHEAAREQAEEAWRAARAEALGGQ